MTPVFIEGNRANLRDWSLDDLDAYADWMRPGHRWQELDGPYYKHKTEAEIPGHVDTVRERIIAGDIPEIRTHLIIAEPGSNRLLGMVSRYWISYETNWLAAGIVVYDPAQWGKGYGFDALGLWTDYLFSRIPQIARLDLQTWSGNVGMMRLADKLGYQLEGRFRKARIVKGQFYDALGYGILREEWNALHPAGFGAIG
jgi:RimJ/RimL family protein N-acetyltransferase